MNGTSDYLQLPSMTMKKFVIDAYWELPITDYHILLDTRIGETNGYIYAMKDGSLITAGATFSVSPTIAFNSRQTITFNAVNNIDGNGNFTDNPTIFANNTGGENYKGKIYSIKCYNANNVLIANYDMSTGTVQDQSGNGNHATLNGGAWLDSNRIVVVSDSFNRTANATSLGSTDSVYGGTSKAWQISPSSGGTVYGIDSSGQAYASTPSGTRTIATVDTGVSDGQVSLRISTYDSSNKPKLVLRATDENNMLLLGTTGNMIEFYSYQNGTIVSFWDSPSTTGETIANGDILSVKMEGSTISLYKNGVLLTSPLTVTFNQTATKFGINMYNYGLARVDNFIFEKFPSPKSFQVWNGTSLTNVSLSSIKSWNGTSFVPVLAVKVWDGNAWVDVIVNSNSIGNLDYWIKSPFKLPNLDTL
jgi:hypothetical protein